VKGHSVFIHSFFLFFSTPGLPQELRQEAQLSLGWPTVLVVSDIQGHPRSVISISCNRAYGTSY